MEKLPVRYAVLIMCIWELAFVSFVTFFGELIDAVRTYGGYPTYAFGTLIWIVIVVVFGGMIPFCFTDYFDEKEDK